MRALYFDLYTAIWSTFTTKYPLTTDNLSAFRARDYIVNPHLLEVPDFVQHSETAGAVTEGACLLDLHWPGRLEHISTDAVQSIRISDNVHMRFVRACKDHSQASSETSALHHRRINLVRKSTQTCALLLSRVWGPADIIVTFSHNHMHYTRITLLRTKDEALDAYEAFAASAEN